MSIKKLVKPSTFSGFRRRLFSAKIRKSSATARRDSKIKYKKQSIKRTKSDRGSEERKGKIRNVAKEVCDLGVAGLSKQYMDEIRTYKPNDDQYIAFKKILQEIDMKAPMKSTVNDFWIMIMQENVRYIIMLCNLVENGKKKCHMPDQGVPTSELAPFEILKVVRRSTKRPIVVHCSAGVGRTGTIIAIEMGLEQLLHCVPLNMVELCKELRNMRAFSIQTDIQYVYIVKCLLAYAWCCGIFINTPALLPKSDSFDQEYKEFIKGEYSKPTEESMIVDQIPEILNKGAKIIDESGKRNVLSSMRQESITSDDSD
ncbi:Protein-tyrosine phosphatase domain containing protein [Dirofilaria immitis]|nr:Protein-tyrosine phosphatase domain containing protein [Dirofilaria immitis]